MTMRVRTTASDTLSVGHALVLQGDSPDGRFGAAFEDDGDTGYFYALDANEPGNPIRDALHIYNAAGVADAHKPSSVKIAWSETTAAVVLLINDYPHAVFDFDRKRGWCRNGFPPFAIGGTWSKEGHNWEDAALELFS